MPWRLAGGTEVLVDGVTGEIEIGPDAEDARAGSRRPSRSGSCSRHGPGPARTADGTAVKVLANVADGASAAKAADGPVEGSGLFRTELCFLNRKDEPSVEEQADLYAPVLVGIRRGAQRRRPHARCRLGQAGRVRHA